MDICIKTDTKQFKSLMQELNVSEGDLMNAIETTGKDLQREDKKQMAQIRSYFNIDTVADFNSKKEMEAAKKAKDSILKAIKDMSPAQIKRAKIQLNKLGIPYTVYTDSNGKQAIRMATPVYKNEDDEIVLNPGAFSTNPEKITQSAIKDITKHFGSVVGIRASNSDESGDVIITFSKGLEVPVSLQSGMMDWSLDSNVKLAEKLGLVKKEKGEILVQSFKTHNVFFALSNLAYNWLQSMPRHANLLRDTIKQSELTALNKELRGKSYDASKDTTLATRMFIPRSLMREREVSSGKAKLTNYRYNTETTTPELDFVTDKGNNITIWWDTNRNEFECRITKKGKKNPESNLDVFDSKEQKQKYLKGFLTDSYIKFFESGEAEKLNNEDARTSYTTKLNDALNSRFGIIYKQLTSDDYVPAKKTKAAKTDDNEEVKGWAVKSDKGFEVSTKAAKDKKANKKTPLEIADEIVKRIRENSQRRIEFDLETHTYYVDGVQANLSVTQYWELINEKTTTELEERSKEAWFLPSGRLGITADRFTRDWFSPQGLKESYPNLNKAQIEDLKDDMRYLEKMLDDKFGGKRGEAYEVVTDEFPIAAKYQIPGQSSARVMAGTMDMLVYDKQGNFYIFDMKAKRSPLADNSFDKRKYRQQLNMYRSILEVNYPELKGKIKELNIIEFRVGYPAPVGAINREGEAIGEVIYEEGHDIQVIADGKLIQNTKSYSAPRLVREFLPLKHDEYDMFEALSPEDAASLEEEVGATKTIAENVEESMQDIAMSNLYGNPILSATERNFLANYVMNFTSFIITHLQTMEDANKYYFEDRFADKDFTKMSREQIIKEVGVGAIFNYIKEHYYNPETSSIDNDDILDKLQVAYDNFSALIRSAYAKLITLEGVTVVEAKPEDVKKEDIEEGVSNNMDAGTLEEKEREYWQMGQRQVSVRASLSGEIRRAFEKLFVVDSNGKRVKDKYGFGFDTFVDSGEAVNSILDWVQNCTTMEEMVKMLREKASTHPWLNSILDKVEEEPFRSQFFQNFRKDFTTYSIVRVEYDEKGNRRYVTEIINTKGAAFAVMTGITNAFKLGQMKDLIIPIKGDINGAGRVNITKVETLKQARETIAKRISKAYNSDATKNKSKFAKELNSSLPELTILFKTLGLPVDNGILEETFISDLKSRNFEATNISKLLVNAGNIIDTILENKSNETYNPMEKGSEGNVYSHYKNMTTILSNYIQDSVEASTYENGKMHYSFTTPSYMGKLVTNLSDAIQDEKKFNKFIKEEYTSYKWFKDGNTWNNEWLRLIVEDPNMREGLQHKVQLSFDKTPYTDLSELGYTMSLISEYFYDKNEKWAWYRLPILANKPSSEFIRFKRYSGKNYKKRLVPLFKKTFNQELMRMRTVLERAATDNKIQRIGSKGKLTFDINPNSVDAKFKQKVNNGTLTIKDLVKDGKLIFSKSGAAFKFLPAFNEALIEYSKAVNGSKYDTESAELGKLILDKLNQKESIDEARLDKLFNSVFTNYMELIVAQEHANWEALGLFDLETKTRIHNGKSEETTRYKYVSQLLSNEYDLSDEDDLEKAQEEIDKRLEEYVWNDMFATINIIELTATDIAYYKSIEDFQKRYSQVHAPSMRLNTTAKMKNGQLYADKYERTMYLADNIIQSEIIPNVATIFDRKIAGLSGTEKKHMKMMKDLIVSAFKDVNVADAQGFSSPTSLRKKLAMQGQWSDEMEEAYERIKSGNFNVNDLGIVWQPEKPFVYSQIRKNSGVSTMSELKVGVQNKNSEYLLVMADALMRSGNQANKLGAIFDFMEDSAYTGRKSKYGKVLNKGEYNARGIDTIQFISAVNAGSMGAIDINNLVTEEAFSDPTRALYILVNALKETLPSRQKEVIKDAIRDVKRATSKEKMLEVLKDAVYEEIKAKLHDAAFKSDDESISTNAEGKAEIDPYNDQFVHNIPWEDYGIQQAVPQHLQDHEQLMGSQVRILSISDITPGTKFQVYTKNGMENMNDRELIQEYQNLIAENIHDSFNQLKRELKLTGTKKQRNRALSNLLEDAIFKDQRYGKDLLRACSLNSNDEFLIPLNDPIQSIRIQQLINSIIKSRVNKQNVKGGSLVQATSFGLSDDLHIIFKDSEGNILPTLQEFGGTEAQYKKYLEETQASVAYFECYMPIPSSDLEKVLLKADGSMMSIDEAVKKKIIPEEMRKAIGYRIPTEDKYSMFPLRIKGFLPKAAGEAIMMPKEITLLSGSDFDIDKCYIMLKEFKEYSSIDTSGLRKHFKEITSELQKRKKLSTTKAGYNNAKAIRDAVIENTINSILQRDKGAELAYLEGSDDMAKASQELYKWYKKNIARFNTISYREGNISKRAQRNNRIFDIQWSVLTNADTMDKMFNPGSFDVQKVSARKVNLLKAGYSWKDIKDLTLDELDELSESHSNLNITQSTTQVYFHKQNMTAGKLIGVFANNNTSHAFLSMQNISFRFEDNGFTFLGERVDNTSNNRVDLQRGKDGALISKTIAGFLAASVDAVKDPVLNFMNLNSMTAGPAMVLARLGFDSDSIGLLLTQPIIESLTREYFKRNNEGYASVEDVIGEYLLDMKETYGIDSNVIRKDLINTDFTKEELAAGLNPENSDVEFQVRALLLFQKLASMSQDLQTVTFITKFNSVTNAVGPTIADTLVMREKFNKFRDKMLGEHAPFNEAAIPENILNGSPILKAFYDTTVADSGASRLIFEPYFPHYSDKFKDILDTIRRETKGNLDSKTINKLVNDYMLYKLTYGEHPVLDASLKNRDAYINKFVSTFAQKANGIVDNELIKIITTAPSNDRCPVETLEAKTGGYGIDVQERVKDAWTTLIQNPKTRNLGVELFFYNMFRSGFSFSPKTFMHLASVDVKLAIDGYISSIEDPTYLDKDINVTSFLMQFRRNHTQDFKIVPRLSDNKHLKIQEKKSLKGTQLAISFDRDKNGIRSIITEESESGDTFAPVIVFNDAVYMNPRVFGHTVTYTETTPLGNANNFLEYNANEDNIDMVSVLGYSSQEEETDNTPPSDKDGDPDKSKTKKTIDAAKVTEVIKKVYSNQRNKSVLAREFKRNGEDAAMSLAADMVMRLGKIKNLPGVKEQILDIIKSFC